MFWRIACYSTKAKNKGCCSPAGGPSPARVNRQLCSWSVNWGGYTCDSGLLHPCKRHTSLGCSSAERLSPTPGRTCPGGPESKKARRRQRTLESSEGRICDNYPFVLRAWENVGQIKARIKLISASLYLQIKIGFYSFHISKSFAKWLHVSSKTRRHFIITVGSKQA